MSGEIVWSRRGVFGAERIDVQIALLIVLCFLVADAVVCALLFAFVWVEHRRVRREAAAEGRPIPSASRQLGCLTAMALAGLGGIYLAAWLLLS